MATSTEAAIRDRIIDLIAALTPTSMADIPFRPYRNEYGANFRRYLANNGELWRLFQVRTIDDHSTPEVSNADVVELIFTVEVIVAYPQSHRAGPDGALDRDDVMDADQHQIENAIGMHGRANFSGTYDACWHSRDEVPRDEIEGYDLLVIRQKMIYQRQMA